MTSVKLYPKLKTFLIICNFIPNKIHKFFNGGILYP